MSKFNRVIVIGTGAVANSCALCVMNAGEIVELIESRLSAVATCRQFCEKRSIPYRLLTGNDLSAYLRNISDEVLIVSAANRYLFPKDVISKPNLTIVNYHGALLPKHPGRNAEAWAIYEGDSEAGITWHYVVPDVDAGNILIQKSTPITDSTTSFTLLRSNSKQAVEAFDEILPGLLEGTLVGKSQTERHDIHFSWMKPNNGELDLKWDYRQISRFLRSMDYGPLGTLGEPILRADNQLFSIVGYNMASKRAQEGYDDADGKYVIRRTDGELELQVVALPDEVRTELGGGK